MIERYAEMIRACIGGKTQWQVDSRRPADRAVAAYWSAQPSAGEPVPTVPARISAGDGERIAVGAWNALTRGDASLFDQVAAAQQSSGAYFQVERSDNLETLWYWELVLLHALAAYAIRTGSSPLLDSARRAAAYHLNETQPDHATTEPWALNAFLLSPDTWPQADQVLHTVRIQHPGGADGVAGILLADTLRQLDRSR